MYKSGINNEFLMIPKWKICLIANCEIAEFTLTNLIDAHTRIVL